MAVIERKASWAVKVHRGGGRYEWIGSFRFDEYGGKREARRAAQRAEAEASQRPVRGRSAETCDEFAARWLDDYPRESPASQASYRYAIQGFARDFAGVRLRELGRDEARRWAAGRPRYQVTVLRAMFNDADDDGLVELNPFEKLYRRRKGKVTPQVGRKKQVWVPTVEELEELAGKALEVHDEYGPTFRAYLLLLAYSGMRPGELAVLQEDHVDVAAREIYVAYNLDGTGRVNDYTKNERQRTIALLEGAVEALGSYPRRVDRRGPDGSPLLFTGPDGALLGKGPRHHAWNPVRAAFGRPKLQLRHLRHFCATYLLELGVPEVDVAVQLGHTDGGALVRSTYGHAERSSLGRIRAAEAGRVTPIRGANESQEASGSA